MDINSTKPIMARANEWILGDDTGRSSITIWARMMGSAAPSGRSSPPLDSSDFGRCLRLLDKIPEWRPRLGEMSHQGPAWAALISHWDELERLYREGSAVDCSRRIRELTDKLDSPVLDVEA